MAAPYAIAAVGQGILAVLAAARPAPEFSGALFELYHAKNFLSPMNEGISLYLHRITPGSNVRNLQPRVVPDGRRFRPSVPVDLHYLLIPWAQDAFKQQRLLGWAIRVLEDTRILHASLLNQHGPEPDLFAPTESVDLLMQTLSLADLHAIWEVTKPNMQPSVGYVVRSLLLDSPVEFVEADLVQTRDFGMGTVVPA
jgi:Pvc16 N-terminal domain